MESSSPPTPPPPPRKSSSTGRVRRAASLKAQKNLQNEKPVKRKRVKRMASSVEVPLGPPSFPSDDYEATNSGRQKNVRTALIINM